MIIVFSKEWFKKYNNVLVKIARLPIIGELVFNFKKFGHYVDRNKIVEITPNSVKEYVEHIYSSCDGTSIRFKEYLFIRNEYALRLQSLFYPVWNTFHTWDMVIANQFAPQLNLGFDTLTQYPASIGANNPVAGHVRFGGSNDTFATIRGGTVGIAGTNNDVGARIAAGDSSNGYNSMRRGIALFDTSSLTTDAIISEATLSFYVNSKSDTMSQSVGITSVSLASDTALVDADYNVTNFGSTRFATDKTIASISTSAYNDWLLNTSGINATSKTANSKFALRVSCDIDNSAPTWSSSADASINVNFVDTNLPKLVIIYTVASPKIFVPDDGTGNTTVDGQIRRHNVNESFATIRGGAGTEAMPTDTIMYPYLAASSTQDQFQQLGRAIMTFDTSSIDDLATITGAVFSGYSGGKSNALGTMDMILVGSTPAANNNLSSSDYAQLGSTSFGSIAYADFAASQYNDITLNASGLAAISKTGITKLGLVGSWDFNGSFSGTWSSTKASYIVVNTSENYTNKPKLTVTYTLPVTFIPQIIMM